MTRIRFQSPLSEGNFTRADVEAKIVETLNQDDLNLISMPNIQAVIYRPPTSPSWLKGLAAAVETGQLRIQRVALANVTIDEIATWLDNELPPDTAPSELYALLKQEILGLVECECLLTGASRFILRIFTESPTLRCGFHVDTAVPRAPAVGLLRVFNGPGTKYVDPANITNMRDFYRYLSQRERLGKELEKASKQGDIETVQATSSQIESLEMKPGFLLDPEDIREVAAGAIIAFKHVDIRHHWSNHPKNLAWVHSSPSEGVTRLVVNVTAHEQ